MWLARSALHGALPEFEVWEQKSSIVVSDLAIIPYIAAQFTTAEEEAATSSNKYGGHWEPPFLRCMWISVAPEH